MVNLKYNIYKKSFRLIKLKYVYKFIILNKINNVIY